MRRTIIWVIVAWAIAGLTIALTSLPLVNPDARTFALAASILGPLCALIAAWAYTRQQIGATVTLLVLSAATPTYGAWIVSLVPIVIAVVILVARSRDTTQTP